jgi:hypothetical protein
LLLIHFRIHAYNLLGDKQNRAGMEKSPYILDLTKSRD